MSMDTDEFYKTDELAYAKRRMIEDGLDGTVCKMRYFKEPTYEMLPFDEMNQPPSSTRSSKAPPSSSRTLTPAPSTPRAGCRE